MNIDMNMTHSLSNTDTQTYKLETNNNKLENVRPSAVSPLSGSTGFHILVSTRPPGSPTWQWPWR